MTPAKIPPTMATPTATRRIRGHRASVPPLLPFPGRPCATQPSMPDLSWLYARMDSGRIASAPWWVDRQADRLRADRPAGGAVSEEQPSERVLSTLTAGLVIGLVEVILAVAFGNLVFGGYL